MKSRAIRHGASISCGVVSVAAVAVLAVAPPAASAPQSQLQDLDRVRTLYVAAAYEEALAAIPTAGAEPARTDLEQYRALCLLALGREEEAVAAVERLVRANPTFLPPAADTSPRMQAIVSSVRSRVVPEIVKRTYFEGKGAYEAKNRPAAHAAFQRTLDLIGTLPEPDQRAMADVRVLAAEFRELSVVVTKIPPVTPLPPAAYVGPVAIREELPAWNPPDSTAMRTAYNGVLRLVIGADGYVQSLRMVRGSHPAYDAAAIRAARHWKYSPATMGGQPVESSKDIQIQLRPR